MMTYTLDNYSSQAVSNKDNRPCISLAHSSAKENLAIMIQISVPQSFFFLRRDLRSKKLRDDKNIERWLEKYCGYWHDSPN